MFELAIGATGIPNLGCHLEPGVEVFFEVHQTRYLGRLSPSRGGEFKGDGQHARPCRSSSALRSVRSLVVL